ncbi:MAG TPA: hypothetical protein V6C81_26610 [Planktothrix sp.]|jgi:hypothetical protein
MSNDQDKNAKKPAGEGGKEEGKGYQNYLNYLKDNKNSKVSSFLGKASDLYNEISKYSEDEASQSGGATEATRSGGNIVGPDAVIEQGVLTKAVEIARLEWVKSKLESEDPVDLSQKYNARMARLNDEYHHKKLLYPAINIVGFMLDKDSKADRLLVSEAEHDKVFCVDPKTGTVIDVFEASIKNCVLVLRRAD